MTFANANSPDASSSLDVALPSSKEAVDVSHEFKAGFFSRLVFQWITPLMTAGYNKPLQESDVWAISPERGVTLRSDHLQAAFQRRQQEGKPDALIWALLEVFKKDFWLAGFALFWGQIFQILAPLTVRYLILFVSQEQQESSEGWATDPRVGIALGLVLFLIQVGMSFGFCHGIYYGSVVGCEMRASLISVILKKSLRLPSIAKGNADGSSMVNPDNLIGTDTQAIENVMMLFHMIWTGPTAIVLALIVLFYNLGWTAFSGVILMVLGAMAITRVSGFFSARSQEISTARDGRAHLLEELLHAIRWVKINTLEDKFMTQIKAQRAEEISALRRSIAVQNIFTILANSLPAVGAMLSFIIFTLNGYPLTAAEVFSSLAIYNCLRMPLAQLPALAQRISSARVSARRIEGFLTLKEPTYKAIIDESLPWAVEADAATFAWNHISSSKLPTENGHTNAEVDETQPLLSEAPSSPAETEAFKLNGITFKANAGMLVAVAGEVASGKSSLLAGLAGEMPQLSGKLSFRHPRAYCSQTAWIMTGSIRENILFGRPMKPDFYDSVVAACALRADFDILVNGDLTQVGERGVTLSGGQKQRISLARAIYSDCETVLLDDPLSAVDADVGHHILHNAILGLLKEKCTIIATHQYNVLPYCDNIIWMEKGSIKAQGTLQALKADSNLFASLSATAHPTESNASGKKASTKDAADVPETSKDDKPVAAQMVKEDREVGIVSGKVYLSYLTANGWSIPWLFVAIMIVVAQVVGILTNVWLSWWSGNFLGFSTEAYIGGYAGLIFVQYLLSYLSDVIHYATGLNTSEAVFERTLGRVLVAPLSFFDSVPIGRLLGLFTSDVDSLDNVVALSLGRFLRLVCLVASVLVMIAIYLPYFAISFPPIIVLVILGTRYFRASSRELTRYVAQFRGDAMAKAHEAVSGSSTIRAYGAQHRFSSLVDMAIDRMNSASLLNMANGPWLAVRGDMIGNFLILLTALLVVESRGQIAPAVAGLVLTLVITIAQPIPYLIQAFGDLENSMISVERLDHYAIMAAEETPSENDTAVPKSWPQKGDISFKNVNLRYRDDLPRVLSDVNLFIPAGSRVAIVGRTGSGKSTILSALARLSPIESDGGRIEIDQVDIASVSLRRLRSSIAMIPQDPVIFAGTVRSNLDPENVYDDETLLSVMRSVGLLGSDNEPNISNLEGESADKATNFTPLTLMTPIPSHGSNLSQGQKQLLALATILLPRSATTTTTTVQPPILILDEPTSALPPNLDHQVHTLISNHWQSRTIIMVAHRLKSLIAAHVDLVIVMDQGKVAEIGSMKDLWTGSGSTSASSSSSNNTATNTGSKGRFRELCDAAGIKEEDFLN